MRDQPASAGFVQLGIMRRRVHIVAQARGPLVGVAVLSISRLKHASQLGCRSIAL
jgi:hypothetical protein